MPQRTIPERNSKRERTVLPTRCFAPPATRSSSPEHILGRPHGRFLHMEYSKHDMPQQAVRSVVEAIFALRSLARFGMLSKNLAFSRGLERHRRKQMGFMCEHWPKSVLRLKIGQKGKKVGFVF